MCCFIVLQDTWGHNNITWPVTRGGYTHIKTVTEGLSLDWQRTLAQVQETSFRLRKRRSG